MSLAPELSGERLALVVTTTTYSDRGLNQLRAPAQDAAEMASVLADPTDGFLADRGLNDLVWRAHCQRQQGRTGQAVEATA